MLRSMLVLTIIASAVVLTSLSPINAAELLLPERAAQAPVRVRPGCGTCRCLGVVYVRHRDLRSTYGLGFDPRNYDETEPHYYFGPMRSYPRYFGAEGPSPGPC